MGCLPTAQNFASRSEFSVFHFPFLYYLCLVKKLLTIVWVLLFCATSIAQTRSVDSTLVTYYPFCLDSLSLSSPKTLDTVTFHANEFDPIGTHQALYSTLSNIGLAHKAMRFQTPSKIGFDLELPAFSQYIKTERDLKTYLSLLPYSEIRYVMTSGDKEQHLNFRFGRQFLQGLYLSMEYNVNYSPGLYRNNRSENNYFWINALYSTKDQRYRAGAYWYRNKLAMQENGGILYDSVYVQQLESDNGAILTNLSSSTNYVKVSGAGFQQSFNLLPQYKKEKQTPTDTLDTLALATTADPSQLAIDSIDTPTDTLPLLPSTVETVRTRRFTLGRINHQFAYQRQQRYFNETSANLPFYAAFDTVFHAKTTDTTLVHAIRNSLTWNSLGYKHYHDDVPFYLYAGINYDYYKIKQYDYLEDSTFTDRSLSQVILHGGVIMNLFGLTTLTGHAQLVTLGYQIGDFDLRGQWKQRFGKSESRFGKDCTLFFDFDLKRQSPTWFETKYCSNHFRWENDFHAATYLTMDLHGRYKQFNAGVKNTTVNDLIYFGADARPAQHNGIVSISEFYGSAAATLWRFQLEGGFAFNWVSNKEVLHLPAFQSRLKFSFAQPIFKKAATLQPSLTVQYFTKYHADAYMPVLRTFYLQNEVLVGNYPFIDVAVAINVKKADIYVQYSNLFLLTGNRESFIAPHYPMRDSKLFFGINWRLFN